MQVMERVLEQIRRAIRKSGQSRYAISKKSGVEQSALSRLMSGERGLSLEAVEKLADALDVEIIIRPKRRKGR